ncbi:hypothetical protein A3D84_04630 [Candidatus Woesebacteria bacterium RIFCSPHIGHO2_02_FULL_42_20]|uniref:Uncharacterized protein n=1 Tax=Candidatus Woesebacteria bacterium RIFCSPHIGHO2_12_FULL_41_24 TaxID=1802510 RepID=A0A1F8AQT1_9BACT|nr:MAG: hypothetical protein A2873_05705 [Candidatus Woesebacteria bacterium RIFCSPHIGHO2_01_FULL_42_80]OGM34465.1 MAG: hypothetical protein A3D84_04630 [Candidatus Woesebacteria bacterium RIFCSPHIGHO2_02_FULL_42_20]OGM54104.1 MAG: hypothetical protein A3E44_02790 [Candidatus Woesebacteria bacterium RIFCSPHIGHO2_12_FULL_41_24]OGM68372.1 MAG: hypothetical protein A2969_01850 [Candidatus Woesebacteria bacterium RIFCSPLOWO2_01_FULL_42_67]OGM74465.1 MAG: hypothetical protein A3H21_02890 [Candidatus
MYIYFGLNNLRNRFFEWRNRTTESDFLLSPPVAPFELIKKFFKIFAFFLLVAFSDLFEPTVSEARRACTEKLSTIF